MASNAHHVARALPPLSAKHIPGGARPTPAPQNAGAPYYGMISPLAQELNSGGPGGYANMYGGFLPRPSSTFTAGAFSPFSPILPVPVDAPPSPDTPRAEPRLYQYEPGWNLPTGQPGQEGVKLVDFGTLKTLADVYSVARACIQLRKAEVRGLGWDILPTKEASKAMRGSKGAAKDFGRRAAEARDFFQHPDPDYFSWGSWLDALLEEVFVFDALSILLRPKWSKGTGKGLLGSDLDSMVLISGPTIRPLVGLHGEKPRPPAPAYQQYLYGVPRTDLMTMWTERDLEESGLNGAERKYFRGDQLLYLPMVPRRETVYGFPPIERALIPVMSGLQKQGYQLDFFREGTIPGMFISPGMSGSAPMTANQIRELQDGLNAVAGDPAWKHKIIVLPPGSEVKPQKPTEIADQFDEIVMNQVCMAFDIQPMELGITPKVSTTQSPGASNQMAKASQGAQERKATKPLLMFLSDIFNTVLRDLCQQPDMQFVFEGLEEDEDEETLTNLLVSQIGAGLRSIDEGREALGLTGWALPETSDPGWATPTGFVPLGQLTPTGDVAPGQQPNANAPATAQPTGQAGAQPGKPGAPAQAAGKPSGAAKPASGAASTPAHAAASAAASKPSGGNSNGTAASTSAPAKKGEAAELVKAAEHVARRNAAINGVLDNVAQRLQQVAMQYHDNQMGAPAATDAGVQILADGYQAAMDAGSREAAELYDVAVQDFGGMAMVLAQGQRSYLGGLLIAIASSITMPWLQSRLTSYTNTVRGAYNQAVGQTVQASKPDYEIVWHLGESEHCGLCVARDGKSFNFDTLPGYPGDGGFGGPLCEGGPNCACSLEFKEPGQPSLTGTNTQRQWAIGHYQQQLQDITDARAAATQSRADFVSTLPTHTGAQLRALTTDQLRVDIADLANQMIRASGGYPGVSVEPADIPASLITQVAPEWAKSVAAQLQKKFNPGQPRDARGRWVATGASSSRDSSGSSGGGTSGGGKTRSKPAQQPPASDMARKRGFTDAKSRAEARDGAASVEDAGSIGLDADERAAVRGYTLGGDEQVNDQLRHGINADRPGYLTGDQLISHLDASFAKSTALPQDTTMYRGVEEADKMFGPVGSMVGKRFTDKGYTSTTADTKELRKFNAEESGGALLRITTPAGTKVLKIGTLSHFPSEAELLLPRGSSYTVKSDQMVQRDYGRPQRQIDLVMVRKRS